ncbi:putative lipoprotein YiaD precursor [Alienimonas californiensis]|uniref:Putative lipoprotein YiaD n=1 Tax=Alienimonas californiensis TaxID=2527989 RepID=A0A517P8Z6_9PLAN|nr:putative lipoprotein YiaD precursor [Alienimonas californiensis]
MTPTATPADSRLSPAVTPGRESPRRLPRRMRWGLGALLIAALVPVGCDVVPRNRLVETRQTAAALREEVLTAEAERDSLAAQYDSAVAMAEQERAARLAAAQERDALMANVEMTERHAAKLQAGLDIANRRLENLSGERGELQGKYINLLRDVGGGDSPLSSSATARFEELASRYPDFDFDPLTGISKFGPHVLFESGKAELNPGAVPLLREFAEIMSSPEAKDLNILIVGHTDDERIAGGATREKHPTNWHLSTNRANEVATTLSAAGLAESRMGVAGYSKYQPVVRNRDDSNRAMNRRVEIYVLAPEVKVAGAMFPTRL